MSYGLATKIASAQESTTFDLSHVSAAAILTIMSTVFSKPFPLSSMIRLTFIVGGGKATRAKYDDGALASCVSALKKCGYREDKGGGCDADSAGSYKIQHDTGKNVKTVVVFPLISGGDSADLEEKEDENSMEDDELLPRGSICHKIAVSSVSLFTSLLAQNCPTYLQKKQCLRTLSGLLEIQSDIEQKLIVGQQLDPAEKCFYDSATDLKDKMEHVQAEASAHIEEGNLTAQELKILIEMNEQRIQTLVKAESSAGVAEQLKKALGRKELLSRTVGNEVPLPPLRLESHITPLRKKFMPLKALEEASRHRYLTLAETEALSGKDELEKEIERLEDASCGWFEEEDVFATRVQASRDRFEQMHAARAAKKGGAGSSRSVVSSVSGGSTKWILPGESSKSKGTVNAWGGGGNKRSMKGGAVFSAMMMDSSSEEESDDDDGDQPKRESFVRKSSVPRFVQEQRSNFLTSSRSLPNAKSVGSASRSSADSTITNWSLRSASSKTLATVSCNDIASLPPPPGHDDDADLADSTELEVKSKKKKKKKKGKSKKSNGNDDDLTNATKNDAATESNQNNSLSKGAVDDSTISQSLGVFITLFLQLLWAFLSLLFSIVAGLFFGGSGKKVSSKKQQNKVK